MRFILPILMITLFALSFGDSDDYDKRCDCKHFKKVEGLFDFCKALSKENILKNVVTGYLITVKNAKEICKNSVKSKTDKNNCENLVNKFKDCPGFKPKPQQTKTDSKNSKNSKNSRSS